MLTPYSNGGQSKRTMTSPGSCLAFLQHICSQLMYSSLSEDFGNDFFPTNQLYTCSNLSFFSFSTVCQGRRVKRTRVYICKILIRQSFSSSWNFLVFSSLCISLCVCARVLFPVNVQVFASQVQTCKIMKELSLDRLFWENIVM